MGLAVQKCCQRSEKGRLDAPRELRAPGRCTDSGSGRLGVGNCLRRGGNGWSPRGSSGWSKRWAQAWRLSRPLLCPMCPMPPLDTGSPFPGRFIPIFGAGSAAIPSFCPFWLQVVPPGDSWDIPPIHCTSLTAAPSPSQTCWQTQHQQPEKPLAGISGHTSGAWFLQKCCKMHRKTLMLPNPCEAADLTCPPHCPVLPAGFQSGMESRASPQGWSSSGLLGEAPWGAGGDREPPFPVGTCPTWWWGTSSCARSAQRRRRRRSRTGGCACREGGRCWEWPIGIS